MSPREVRQVDPQQRLILELGWEALENAALPFAERQMVVLSDVQGLSYQEIAEATGSRLGTVKSRLSRARAKLREELRGSPAASHEPVH